MIGKPDHVRGDTREQALARMRIALSETVVEGILTNIPLHRELMVDAKFIEGGTSIHYLEGWMSAYPGADRRARAGCPPSGLPTWSNCSCSSPRTASRPCRTR